MIRTRPVANLSTSVCYCCDNATWCFYLTADVARTRKEMEIEVEKLERQKENLAMKLAQTEKDLQLALKQEQQAHEEDIDRLTKEKVGGLGDIDCDSLTAGE